MTTPVEELTYQALDDVPRTAKEIWKRVDLCSPRTIGGHLRTLSMNKRAIAEEERIDARNITRKRYRRAP